MAADWRKDSRRRFEIEHADAAVPPSSLCPRHRFQCFPGRTIFLIHPQDLLTSSRNIVKLISSYGSSPVNQHIMGHGKMGMQQAYRRRGYDIIPGTQHPIPSAIGQTE